MEAIYSAAQSILDRGHHSVLIDGRTFSKSYQVQDLISVSEAMDKKPRIIECICSDDMVRVRLERDRESSKHPAGNRTYEMYLEVKAQAETLAVPRFVLDTGNLSLEECVAQAHDYIERSCSVDEIKAILDGIRQLQRPNAFIVLGFISRGTSTTSLLVNWRKTSHRSEQSADTAALQSLLRNPPRRRSRKRRIQSTMSHLRSFE